MHPVTENLFERLQWIRPGKLAQVEWLLSGEPEGAELVASKAEALMEIAAWLGCLGQTGRAQQLWRKGAHLLLGLDQERGEDWFYGGLAAIVTGVPLQQDVSRFLPAMTKACDRTEPLSRRVAMRSALGGTLGYWNKIMPVESLAGSMLETVLADMAELDGAGVYAEAGAAAKIFLADEMAAAPKNQLKRFRHDEKVGSVDEAFYAVCLGGSMTDNLAATLWRRPAFHELISQATRGPVALAAYAYLAYRLDKEEQALGALERAEQFIQAAMYGDTPRGTGRKLEQISLGRALPFLAQVKLALTKDRQAAEVLFNEGWWALVRNDITGPGLAVEMERLLLAAASCRVELRPHMVVTHVNYHRYVDSVSKLVTGPMADYPVPPHLILPTLGGLFISQVPSWVYAHAKLDSCSTCLSLLADLSDDCLGADDEYACLEGAVLAEHGLR